MAASLLSIRDPATVSRSSIREAVELAAKNMSMMYDEDVSEGDVLHISKKLEERFDIRMSLGTLFSAEDYRPWLDDARGDIEWYYWDRYRRLLIQDKFPPHVIRSQDSITDQILDHLENPKKEGRWARKGMVVGHVQSGKTANYIGLVCKAADGGYRVIIVLAGLLNSLRSQTQGRLDSGFVGRCSLLKKTIGVGVFSNERSPAYFTTSAEDFRKSVAEQIGVGIGDLKEPVLLVVKKNKRTLENLIAWLKYNNPHNLKDYPTLLIDDEADHASINTNDPEKQPTAINDKIRELLHLFDRSSYLGYTATPFANVFIDPETDDDMLGDDLFPRDFIFSLDPPDNYVGPSRVFFEEGDLRRAFVEVKDHERCLPVRHKIDFRPTDLPASLRDAISSFVLVRAIRLLRHQADRHNSMMINASRFTSVQTHLKYLVDEFLKELRQAITNHYMLPGEEALENAGMARLKRVWDQEFSEAGHTWDATQKVLKDAVSPIGVIEVNSSSTAEPLDYSERNYPNGRNVIAIGGLSLSRGLTLEGLTVSYFLRNSIMYDTLMQMARWFGYRDGYADLCRVFMTSDALSWYQHISEVIEELREEFGRMKAAGMSPKDFGLCVRSHPESLIVTARNKMRTGKKVLRQINLEGRLVETAVLWANDDAVKRNMAALSAMVADAKKHGRRTGSPLGFLWQSVPQEYILRFVDRFENHPASQLTEGKPIKEYINWLAAQQQDQWDVVLVSLAKNLEENIVVPMESEAVITQARKGLQITDSTIELSKRRVASRGLEKVGLNEGEVRAAESGCAGKNVPDHAYRGKRSRPLLMLHVLDCKGKDGKSLFKEGIAAWGISFPGEAGRRKAEKLVEYVVNTVWWQNAYGDMCEDSGELDHE